jgi:predicted ArsR family transcriptional regulator
MTKRGADDLEFRPLHQQLAGLGMFEPLTRPSIPAESRRAAREQAETAERERAVLAAFKQFGKMTPDECARRMGLDKTQVRPRCTNLSNPERYAGIGQRPPLKVVGEGVSAMGNKQSIYDLTERAEAAA